MGILLINQILVVFSNLSFMLYSEHLFDLQFGYHIPVFFRRHDANIDLKADIEDPIGVVHHSHGSVLLSFLCSDQIKHFLFFESITVLLIDPSQAIYGMLSSHLLHAWKVESTESIRQLLGLDTACVIVATQA